MHPETVANGYRFHGALRLGALLPHQVLVELYAQAPQDGAQAQRIPLQPATAPDAAGYYLYQALATTAPPPPISRPAFGPPTRALPCRWKTRTSAGSGKREAGPGWFPGPCPTPE
ncbi:hypothetical protein [Hymenobacter actinosclerus]|uniref:hypothetical protein n=1 Tax=Hymenobacter actinosclerus TaxID=82805 RepID=UPI00116099BE|nr:hypothetical protein [Hymenobacter actinosclerus]